MTQSANKLDEALQHQFARVSWRLALRLGYADHISLVRTAMRRFMEDHYLNNLVDFDEDPTGRTEDGDNMLKQSLQAVAIGEMPDVKRGFTGSFFGTCFAIVESADQNRYKGEMPVTYWGLSKELYMMPVHDRLLRLFGAASVMEHNLDVIERALKHTVGTYDRKRPTIEETIARVKERKEIIRTLTDKPSVFGGKGLVRRHVLGQPTVLTARAPIG